MTKKSKLNKLSEKEKELLKKELEKELYNKSFYEFFKKAVKVLEPSTQWSFNWHHEYICDILQEETLRIKNNKQKTKDIIINVPFRSSKSLMVSVCYPVWSWTQHNQMSFINLSYSASLSSDHSNKVIELLSNPWFQNLYGEDYKLNYEHSAKNDFKLNCGGHRISSGMVGSVLGKGADIIIMDDPNSPKDLSEVGRRNTIRSYTDTISTRLNNPETGLFIVVQQRLHENDLTGYLLSNFKDDWNHICLPATISKNVSPSSLINKYKDGYLWKDRFSKKVLDKFKITLGSINYANQLQQEGSVQEGNIIKRKWLKTISLDEFNFMLETNKINEHNIKWEMIIDTALTAKKKNDDTGIMIYASILNNVYVKKVFKLKLEFPELIKEIINIYNIYKCKIIKIEPKANGLSVIQQIKRSTKLPVKELPNKGKGDDKESCLNSVSPLIESGRFIMLEDLSNDILISQLTGFPNEKSDEMVDLTYYALSGAYKGNFNYAML